MSSREASHGGSTEAAVEADVAILRLPSERGLAPYEASRSAVAIAATSRSAVGTEPSTESARLRFVCFRCVVAPNFFDSNRFRDDRVMGPVDEHRYDAIGTHVRALVVPTRASRPSRPPRRGGGTVGGDDRPAGVVSPVVRAVCEHLPFHEGAFDAAMALLTTHHWHDPAAGLDEL